jgi:hypothetical protein
MPTWYILLDGPQGDLVRVKQAFASSGFTFDEIDGKAALAAPIFEQLENEGAVIDAGMELLAQINTALRLSGYGYAGFGFHGLVQKKADGTTHRTMFAAGASYGISGVAAVGLPGSIGKPVRSKEERLVSLIARSPTIEELAVLMTAYPLTWGSMNTTYESVKGLMSSKTGNDAKRGDYQGLIDRGWITSDESIRFYKTAAFHRHGYPKIDMKGIPLMDHTTASILIRKLFWHMVDEMEPT